MTIVILMAIIALCAGSLIEGAIVMWLWNWLAVSLFAASSINFWTGWGIAFALNFIAGFFKARVTVNNKK